MTRGRRDIAYDGANFSGWATQPDRRTKETTPRRTRSPERCAPADTSTPSPG